MNAKLEFNIEIDEARFKNLTKDEIEKVVKETENNMIKKAKYELYLALERENFEKESK